MARILAFDDSKMVRGIVCDALEDSSHEVRAVCPDSIYDALRNLYQSRPDLLITDYNMPNVNGETLIRVIKEDVHLAGLKVLMLSAHHEAELIDRILGKGVDGYILKNSNLKVELPRRIEAILQG